MDITLTDIAKYAYGNGFNEGIKGGRGFLTVSDSGELSKVYTHRSDAKKLNTLSADDFQALKAGSDRLAQSLFQIAKTKLSGQWLATVCDRLGLDETGVPREGGENAPRAQRLLDRKVVASVVSLIDPDVWNGGKEGGVSIAKKAKEVTTAKANTDGAEVLASQREVAAMVKELDVTGMLKSWFRSSVEKPLFDDEADVQDAKDPKDPQKVKESAEQRVKDVERFGAKLETLIAQELARLPRDGTLINGRPSKFRLSMTEVIVDLMIEHLQPLLEKNPDLYKTEPSNLNLISLINVWPQTTPPPEKVKETVKMVYDGEPFTINLTRTHKHDSSPHPIGNLKRYGELSDSLQNEVDHAMRIVIKNALPDVYLQGQMPKETLVYRPHIA
ncbi:MAG: hypothetical protein MJ240_01930 [Kiritimatiellae bacterium]|nr:hypothetical protein [Kiritimatiellia bacterium]